MIYGIDHVVGITAPQAPTLLEHGYRPTGCELEQEVTLEAGVIDRIAEFYKQCKAVPGDKRPRYDCHSFAAYAAGNVDDVAWRPYHRYDAIVPELPRVFRPGAHYGVVNRDGIVVHAALGIDRPDQNLSILGMLAPLALTRNDEMIQSYGGVDVLQFVR